MRRLLALVAVLGLGVASGLLVTEARTDREFRRLIAEGDAALAAGQTFRAIEAFSDAIALRGDAMIGYLKRGETNRRRGELSSALRDLRMAAALDPTATRPLEQLGDVNYQLQRYTRAADRYAEYVALDDRSSRVLYKLGLARYREGQVEAGIAALDQAVRIDEGFAEAYYLLGLCHRALDRPEDARDAFERAIRVSPAFIQAREELMALHSDLGHMDDALGQLEALAALDPGRPERYSALGLAWNRAGRTDAAVLTIGRAVERFPDHPQLYAALGRVWLDAAERSDDHIALAKALEALHNIASTAVSSEELTLLARADILSGDLETAERRLTQATDRFPVDPSAHRYLADVARLTARPSLARQALVRYLALREPWSDTDERALYAARIGELSLQLNDLANARTWLRRAVDASPDDVHLLIRLATIESTSGHAEEARALIARAIEIDPHDPRAVALRRQID